MAKRSPFDNVVFAGGGCRCFWQAGFYETAAPALGLNPSRIAAVSAGAAVACMIMGSSPAAVVAYFKQVTACNRKNFYPERIFSSRSAFPQYALYRDAILHAIDDAALGRIRRGPELRVLMARPPRFLGPRSGTLVGFLAYTIEKALVSPVHAAAPRRLGYTAEVVDARQSATPDELADLILQSSCTPPFVPIMTRGGRTVLDGGLVDNVPLTALGGAPGETLILLTRTYPPERIPRVDGCTYTQPSRPIAIKKWDYTSPDLLQQTYDLGRRDGEAFAADRRAGSEPDQKK